jgi:hypothetical protein
MSRWLTRAQRTIKRLTGIHRSLRQFAEANLAATEDALEGKGPDAVEADPQSGVRAVVNIASVHVSTFCERSKLGSHPAYLNSYDLKKSQVRVGSEPPDDHWKKREIVDHALASLHGRAMNEVYYAAAELNGAGIRFYGDICLVLKPETVPSDTVVLDRNSYDVLRAPFATTVDRFEHSNRQQSARVHILQSLSGKFRPDLKTIGALKVLTVTGERDRRFSTGQVSGGVLDDEDYLEILKVGSFDAKAVETARLSAAEAALESYVERRLQEDPWTHEARTWLTERRNAMRALEEAGIPVAIIATAGRVKG